MKRSKSKTFTLSGLLGKTSWPVKRKKQKKQMQKQYAKKYFREVTTKKAVNNF